MAKTAMQRVDTALSQELKIQAAKEGVSIKSLLDRLIREYLKKVGGRTK